MTDTAEASLRHWSEASRTEMEGFYALAHVDYEWLAKAQDWPAWLRARQADAPGRTVSLLDVACGSGKFPAALLRNYDFASAGVEAIDYALLDPSEFSLDEAAAALRPPFVEGRRFHATLQDLECAPGAFDVAWATHALYAVPVSELPKAMERFLHCFRQAGFIAHATSKAHYIQYQDLFLKSFRSGTGERYATAEQIAEALTHAGARFQMREISYENGAPAADETTIERYLQRCVFDDSVSLTAMLEAPETGAYLRSCKRGGEWRFSQHVALFFIEPSERA